MSFKTPMSPTVVCWREGVRRNEEHSWKANLKLLPWGNITRFEHPDRKGVPVRFLQLLRSRFSIGAPASALISPAKVQWSGEKGGSRRNKAHSRNVLLGVALGQHPLSSVSVLSSHLQGSRSS